MLGKGSTTKLYSSPNKFHSKLVFDVYRCFVCMYICVPHTYLVAAEARRRSQISWDWS